MGAQSQRQVINMSEANFIKLVGAIAAVMAPAQGQTVTEKQRQEYRDWQARQERTTEFNRLNEADEKRRRQGVQFSDESGMSAEEQAAMAAYEAQQNGPVDQEFIKAQLEERGYPKDTLDPEATAQAAQAERNAKKSPFDFQTAAQEIIAANKGRS